MTLRRALPFTLLVLAVTAPVFIALPLAVHAEGSGHPNTNAPDKPDAVRHAKRKPAVKPPAMPAHPVPYNSLTGTTTAPPRPETSTTTTTTITTSTPVTPNPTTAKPPVPVQTVIEPAPPPPPPVAVAPAPAPTPAPGEISEISLKCTTRTTRGVKVVSSGTFYIDLFPSPVFPDELASFQFRFVDPAHDSLIRGSMCLDTICSAKVSGSAYALVNRVTKKGNALRMSLERSQGAFYAEEIHGNRHLGEQGYCTVQPLPGPKF